jgi:hypothetical protein
MIPIIPIGKVSASPTVEEMAVLLVDSLRVLAEAVVAFLFRIFPSHWRLMISSIFNHFCTCICESKF